MLIFMFMIIFVFMFLILILESNICRLTVILTLLYIVNILTLFYSMSLVLLSELFSLSLVDLIDIQDAIRKELHFDLDSWNVSINNCWKASLSSLIYCKNVKTSAQIVKLEIFISIILRHSQSCSAIKVNDSSNYKFSPCVAFFAKV